MKTTTKQNEALAKIAAAGETGCNANEIHGNVVYLLSRKGLIQVEMRIGYNQVTLTDEGRAALAAK